MQSEQRTPASRTLWTRRVLVLLVVGLAAFNLWMLAVQMGLDRQADLRNRRPHLSRDVRAGPPRSAAAPTSVEGGTPIVGFTPPVFTPPVYTPPVNTPPVNTPPVYTPPVNTPPVSTPPVSTPGTVSDPTLAAEDRVLARQARELGAKAAYQEGIEVLRPVWERNRDNPVLTLELASMLGETDRWADAQAVLEEGLRHRPQEHALATKLAHVRATRVGLEESDAGAQMRGYREVMRSFEPIYRTASEDFYVAYLMGCLRLRCAAPAAARQAFERALSLHAAGRWFGNDRSKREWEHHVLGDCRLLLGLLYLNGGQEVRAHALLRTIRPGVETTARSHPLVPEGVLLLVLPAIFAGEPLESAAFRPLEVEVSFEDRPGSVESVLARDFRPLWQALLGAIARREWTAGLQALQGIQRSFEAFSANCDLWRLVRRDIFLAALLLLEGDLRARLGDRKAARRCWQESLRRSPWARRSMQMRLNGSGS